MFFKHKFTANPGISYRELPKQIIVGIVLLLLYPRCSLQAQEAVTKNPFLFVAHRGASYLAPQNTLASVNLAWELGADAAECDVRLTSDNRVVVFHDKNTKKLCGEKHVIAETPWPVLQELIITPEDSNLPEYNSERIPLLKDLLTTIPDGRTLVIEIKTGTEILPFLKGVVDRYWTRGKIVFISFDFDAVRQAKAIYPDVTCYYLAMFKRDAKKHITRTLAYQLDGMDLRHSIIDEKLAETCREAGLDLWCWTVNDPSTTLRMKQLGVSAVTTDRPGWLREETGL